jgi:Fe-S cluster assembly protein SufD
MTGSAINSEILKYSYKLNKRVGEPQAFELLRSFGQKFLETKNWPTRKDDEWKYTPTQIFSTNEFIPSIKKQSPLDETLKLLCQKQIDLNSFKDSYNLVFINGIFEPSLSNNSNQDTINESSKFDINIAKTVTHEKQHPRVLGLKKAIEKGLYPIFELSKPLNSFEALNLSFLEEGIYIEIPENNDLKPIINLVFLNTQDEKKTVYLPRVIIKVKASAKATIFESYETLGSSIPTITNWTNSQVEIHLEKNALLNWVRLQNETKTQLHTCRTKIYLAENSELNSLLLTQGGNLHRHDLGIEIKGDGASANVFGVSLSNENEHRDHNTLIDFKNGNSKAKQIFKSILHNESKSVFNGKIIIRKNSQKVDSSQLNQNLILSEKAEANSQPQLEIYADDVKATHGATIGQLNDEELFYFKSRGISETKAKLMMTQGFALDLIEQFPNEEIKNILRQKVQTKLKGFW